MACFALSRANSIITYSKVSKKSFGRGRITISSPITSHHLGQGLKKTLKVVSEKIFALSLCASHSGAPSLSVQGILAFMKPVLVLLVGLLLL